MVITKKALLVLLFTALVLFSSCSKSQDDSGVYDGKVYVTGENPVLRLKINEEDKDFVTSASFWRVVYSPVGRGHILYIRSDITGDGETEDDVKAIFTDNKELVEYMNREILTRYLEDPYPVYNAHFTYAGDPRTEWTEVVQSDDYTIVLVWKDFIEPFLVATPIGGERPFGISSVGIPATTAEVYINGTKVVGEAFPEMLGKAQNSTARLWWAESWVK